MWEPWLQAILVPYPAQEPSAGSGLPGEGTGQEKASRIESCSLVGSAAEEKEPAGEQGSQFMSDQVEEVL